MDLCGGGKGGLEEVSDLLEVTSQGMSQAQIWTQLGLHQPGLEHNHTALIEARQQKPGQRDMNALLALAGRNLRQIIP